MSDDKITTNMRNMTRLKLLKDRKKNNKKAEADIAESPIPHTKIEICWHVRMLS
jgi:hypothetical protein